MKMTRLALRIFLLAVTGVSSISSEMTLVQLSNEEKQGFVNAHNEWRRKAGAGAMLRVKWNDELATLAESAASSCSFEHTSKTDRRNVAGFRYIGENIFTGTHKPSAKDVVNLWALESQHYDADAGKCDGECRHYTQVIWAATSAIGCAIADCSSIKNLGASRYLAFCEYGPGGNIIGSRPYSVGTPGSACQKEFGVPSDQDGLCGDAQTQRYGVQMIGLGKD